MQLPAIIQSRFRQGRISLTPSPAFSDSRDNRPPISVFPLTAQPGHAAPMFNGSAAIHHVAMLLDLGKDDTVLMPVYCCGSEQKPFEMLGCQIRYFGLSNRLEFDADAVIDLIDSSTRLIYITHYFGFFQPETERLVSLCQQRNLPVLEDCALALYSGKEGVPCGSLGAYSIFSQRKTLGLTEGGYLVSRNEPLPPAVTQQVAPPAVPALDRLLNTKIAALSQSTRSDEPSRRHLPTLLGLLSISVVVKLFRIVGQKLFKNWQSPEVEGEIALPMYGYAMSARMHDAFVRADAPTVRDKRRENYQVWLSCMDKLPDCRPLFQNLPNDCVPLYMPVLCDDHQRAKTFFDERNIEVSPWWFDERTDIDWAQHADVLNIKRSMLVLPVHQLVDAQVLRQRLS